MSSKEDDLSESSEDRVVSRSFDTVSVAFCNRKEAAVLAAMGVPVLIERSGDSRPHAVSAGIRTFLEWKQFAKLKRLVYDLSRSLPKDKNNHRMWFHDGAYHQPQRVSSWILEDIEATPGYRFKLAKSPANASFVRLEGESRPAKDEISLYGVSAEVFLRELAYYGVCVLYPRVGEVEALKNKFWAEGLNVLVEGNRSVLFGNDVARDRPLVKAKGFDFYHHYVANDVLYHFTPKDLMAELSLNSNLAAGRSIHIHAQLFNFVSPAEGTNYYLERISYPDSELPASDGKDVFVTRGVYIGCHAMVGPSLKDGSWASDAVHFSSGPFEATYDTPNKGEWIFRYTSVFVEHDEQFYRLDIHIERPVGGHFLQKYYVRISITVVSQLQENVLRQSVTEDLFIRDGFMPWLVPMISNKVLTIDPRDENGQLALASLATATFSGMFNAESLRPYRMLLEVIPQALLETCARALEARGNFRLVRPTQTARDTAIAMESAHLQDVLHLPATVADAVADLKQQKTRYGAAVSILQSVSKWISEVIEKAIVWWTARKQRQGSVFEAVKMDFSVDAGLLGSLAFHTFLAAKKMLRRFRWFEGMISWLAAVTRRAFGEKADLVETVCVGFIGAFSSFAEEVLKKLPLGLVWALGLGILESMLRLYVTVEEPEFAWGEFLAESGLRILFHALTTFVPIRIAVLLHASWNAANTVATFAKQWNRRLKMVETEFVEMDFVQQELAKPLESKTSVFYMAGGEKIYLHNTVLWHELKQSELVQTRKPLLISGNLDRSLARPQSSLANALIMVSERLEAQPKYVCSKNPVAWARQWVKFWGADLKLWSWDQLRYYVSDRPWPAAKKSAWNKKIDLCEQYGLEIYGSDEKCVFVKIDEMLNVKAGQLGLWLKVRPVFPATTSGAFTMRTTLPLKAWLDQQFIFRWADGAGWTLARVDREHLLPNNLFSVNGFVIVTTYLPTVNSEILSLVHRYYDTIVDGVVWLMMGDDSKLLFYKEGVRHEAGFDIVKCDASCREAFHRARYTAVGCMFVDENDTQFVKEMCTLELQSQVGTFDISHDQAILPAKAKWEKKEYFTLTGKPDTALCAVMSQQFTFADWANRFGMEVGHFSHYFEQRFLGDLMESARTCGFEYESDTPLFNGKPQWTPAGSVSFLAMLVTPSPACAFGVNWLKQHHYGPALPPMPVEKMRQVMSRHHSAWAGCPDKVLTPLDAAYARWHGRCVLEGHEATWDEYVRSLPEYDQLKWSNYQPFPVPEMSFYETVKIFSSVRGRADPTNDIREWIKILDASSAHFDCANVPHFLYEVRFGTLAPGVS